MAEAMSLGAGGSLLALAHPVLPGLGLPDLVCLLPGLAWPSRPCDLTQEGRNMSRQAGDANSSKSEEKRSGGEGGETRGEDRKLE